MAPKAKPPAGGLADAFRCTLHPPGTTCLNRVLAETQVPAGGTDEERRSAQLRAVILRLLDGPCTVKVSARAGTPIILVKGVVNSNGHGAWVFTYDQRIPNSCWDELTVICRGLVVVFPRRALLEEGVPEVGLSPGARLADPALLRRLCAGGHRCAAFEPMPKFWEGGDGRGSVAAADLEAACGALVPRLLRLEEKVDGNLGLLYPQLDEELRPIAEAEPLLATKGTAHSPDILRQMDMLRQRYPNLRLPTGVSHVIVEVVDPQMKVCVPYGEGDAGARLIVAHGGGRWLPQEDADRLAADWGMRRPEQRPCPEGGTLADLERLGADYAIRPGALLDEGFVAVYECPPLAEVMRLKIHTHVWNVIHDWWEDNPNSKSRLSVATVMPVLRDPRFSGVDPSVYEQSLVKRKDDGLALRFREALSRAEVALDAALDALCAAFERTSALEGKELALALSEVPDGFRKEQAEAVKGLVLFLRRGAAAPPLLPELRRALGRRRPAAAGEAAAETPDELPPVLEDPVTQGLARKLVTAWADVAQAAWDAEGAVPPAASPVSSTTAVTETSPETRSNGARKGYPKSDGGV